MSNFKKRFVISLLAFPIIYILLYQKIFSNLLIIIVSLFCVYEWNRIFKKKKFLFLIIFLILLLFFYFVFMNGIESLKKKIIYI